MYRVRKQLGLTDSAQRAFGEKGVCAAILDTGIAAHPDFDNRLLLFRDFVNEKSQNYDDSGHGSHVTGILAGSGRLSYGKYKGIAPRTKLVVGKVLDHYGDGRVENMEKGIEWILSIKDKYQIRILNISIGVGKKMEMNRIKNLLELVDQAWLEGLVVVCAAGNSGPAEGTISPIGARENVITVGCDEAGYFGKRSGLCENYSSRGDQNVIYTKPEIVAPGTDIISCNAFFEKRGFSYYKAYTRKSGTSMSAPIVSGVVALFLQKYPELPNYEIKKRLIKNAQDLQKPWNQQGAGFLTLFDE